MQVTARARANTLSILTAAAWLSTSSAIGGCTALRAHAPSTVAQGRYYSAGQPRYDEFFVGLFLLQVEMEQAPHVPELERLGLAHSLGLTPRASNEQVEQRLHDEALKLRRSGLRMRLDQSPRSDRPEAASAAVRTSERPKEDAASSWITQVESSATRLLRSVGEMAQADAALRDLDATASALAAACEKDFAEAPASQVTEVRKNLADARELIALMKARAAHVRTESDELLMRVARAIDTDDGSLDTLPEPTSASSSAAVNAAAPNAKKSPKPRPAPARAPARAPPRATAPADGDVPVDVRPKPNRPQPAPRDFEP